MNNPFAIAMTKNNFISFDYRITILRVHDLQLVICSNCLLDFLGAHRLYYPYTCSRALLIVLDNEGSIFSQVICKVMNPRRYFIHGSAVCSDRYMSMNQTTYSLSQETVHSKLKSLCFDLSFQSLAFLRSSCSDKQSAKMFLIWMSVSDAKLLQ
jgi:hypothetical protein